MTHIGLFEGIGGFSLAAKIMNWQTIAWCEINPFCQQVLKYHFPEAEGFGDITKTDFTKYANAIDVLTGGFPCQPYSMAGQRKGKKDERHLFPEMLRAIREVQPRWVVGENVPGLINWERGMVLHEIKTDLENEGFEVFPPVVIPACAKDAPHRRDRVWIIAHSTKANGGNALHTWTGWNGIAGMDDAWNVADTRLQRPAERQKQSMGVEQLCEEQFTTNPNDAGKWWNEWKNKSEGDLWDGFPTQSPLCSGDDGLPHKLDGITFSKWRTESLKAYGNAIVPQVALEIFRVIQEIEQDRIKGAWAKNKYK